MIEDGKKTAHFPQSLVPLPVPARFFPLSHSLNRKKNKAIKGGFPKSCACGPKRQSAGRFFLRSYLPHFSLSFEFPSPSLNGRRVSCPQALHHIFLFCFPRICCRNKPLHFFVFWASGQEKRRRAEGGGARPCRGRERALRCRSVFVSRAAGAKGKKGTEYILVARAQKKPT